MKSFSIILALSTFLILQSCQESTSERHWPQPKNTTQVKWDMEEGHKSASRKAWIESMHRSADDVDWRTIELENQALKRKRNRLLTQKNGDVTIGDDLLSGQWLERGSNNQAGSVLNVEYDVKNDQLYLISAGGSLLRGDRDDDDWEVINQDYRFDASFFELIYLPNRALRLLAVISGKLHISDDKGVSWTRITDLNASNNAGYKDPLVIDNFSGDTRLLTLYKQSSNANIRLMASDDHGESWTSIKQFFTSDFDNLALSKIIGSDQIYLIEQSSFSHSRIYEFQFDDQSLELIEFNSPISFQEGRGNLTGHMEQDSVILTLYNNDDELMRSRDQGKSWTVVSTLPERPWSVGVYQSSSAPNVFVMGAVEAFRSEDYGQTWHKINDWWAYYSDVDYMLHADMMEFEEFETDDENPFWIISNHGGVSISTDSMKTNFNIGQNGLNVSQYYDVVTHPEDPELIYAGTQDQGLQRGWLSGDSTAQLEQVISGDYGHGAFTGEEHGYWTVYPDGWVSYYAEPIEGYLTDSWDLPNPQGAVWIPPVVTNPFESDYEHVVYLAGGSGAEDQSGSYIQRLEWNESGISHFQYPYNFGENGEQLTYLAFSHFDPDIWYAITTSGRFYRSDNGGGGFELMQEQLPGTHYLYGTYILASKSDPNTVYIAGSGYSNAPVWVSYDSGLSFERMSDGLPSTLVFELASDPNEELIFAATEAGPYVYIAQEEQWYPIDAGQAPNQTYWSVEYIDEIKTARFGTYGRGIWDFRINTSVSTDNEMIAAADLTVYPNPTSDRLNISLREDRIATVKIFSSSGQLILAKNNISNNQEFDISELPTGIYLVKILSDTGQNAVQQVVKL